MDACLPYRPQLDLTLVILPEQKKATLRRVEMELDEADEMVST